MRTIMICLCLTYAIPASAQSETEDATPSETDGSESELDETSETPSEVTPPEPTLDLRPTSPSEEDPSARETETAETETEPEDAPLAVQPRSDHRVTIAVAFSHWFSPRIGAPQGISTPSLLVGVRPGVDFLELRLRYVIGILPVTVPSGSAENLGFGSVELLFTHGFSLPGQSIDFHVGVLGGLVHAGDVTGCFGVVLGMLWLLDLGGGMALGPYFETRMVSYPLPGDGFDFPNSIEGDAQVDLGVAFAIN